MGKTIKICQAGLTYAPSSVAPMAIAAEANETTIVRPLVGMRLNKYAMNWEKWEWNGEDDMKAAEHETTRRNTRPDTNILPIMNPSILSFS